MPKRFKFFLFNHRPSTRLSSQLRPAACPRHTSRGTHRRPHLQRPLSPRPSESRPGLGSRQQTPHLRRNHRHRQVHSPRPLGRRRRHRPALRSCQRRTVGDRAHQSRRKSHASHRTRPPRCTALSVGSRRRCHPLRRPHVPRLVRSEIAIKPFAHLWFAGSCRPPDFSRWKICQLCPRS